MTPQCSHYFCNYFCVEPAKKYISVQLLSRVQFFAPPWSAALQASLSITSSQNLPKLMPIESVMPSNHLILCRPLFPLLSIFPSTRVFSNESVLCIYICIYVCVCVCVCVEDIWCKVLCICVCMCICIYIYVEREREREKIYDAKSSLTGRDPGAGKNWGQGDKGMIEDETVGWHHRLDGHELE